jgi:type IV secretion system protein VirD4
LGEVLLEPRVWVWAAIGVFLATAAAGVVRGAGGSYWLRRLLDLRTFGGARWAGWFDLHRGGLLTPGGLFLGRSRFRDIYHTGEGHLFTLGGTGGGKSSGLVVPALCTLTEGSIVVTDPSGELAAMTARRRAEIGPVIFLNPFGSTFKEGTGLTFRDDGFNPFSVLDPESPNFISDTQKLAQLLMVTDRRESGTYWQDEGAEFLGLMIAKIRLYDLPELHHLAFLHGVVRDDVENIKAVLKAMIEKAHPALVDEAQRFLQLAEVKPQWFGVASKVALATKRYAPSTPLGEHTKKNGLNLRHLKTEKITVYVLVPSSMLSVALPWMNLVVGLMSIAIGRPGRSRPVTLLIDEAPALGYLPDLRSSMAQYRKAGLRVWLFTQTYAALAAPELYGHDGVKEILGLSAVKQFFSVEEPEVQEMVSKLCGQRSVSNPSSSGNMGDVGQPLIRPDEVRGLPKWRQIIVRGGLQYPIKARLVPYFKRRAWRAMLDTNPYRGG